MYRVIYIMYKVIYIMYKDRITWVVHEIQISVHIFTINNCRMYH